MSEEEPHIRRAQYAEKKGEVVLRDHVYDGIREYDQRLPNWWLAIFIITHLFFLVYWVGYYNLGWMKTDEQKIDAAMARIEKAQAKAFEDMLAQLDNESLINKWATNPTRVASGAEVYATNCVACHGQDLKGVIEIGGGKTAALPGLPLTDGEWKYGGTPMDIFKLINEGTPPDSSGHNVARMEAWGLKLPPIQIAELTAFIIKENPEEFKVPAP